MKQLLLVLALAASTVPAVSQPVLKLADLKPLVGSWTGQLSYVDYTTKKEVSIKATMQFEVVNESAGIFAVNVDYPNEPGRGDRREFHIAADGRKIGEARVILASLKGNSGRIITEEQGEDDGRHGTIRTIISFDRSSYSQTKLFRPSDTVEFIRRNELQLRR